jgi:hypothetical protein
VRVELRDEGHQAHPAKLGRGVLATAKDRLVLHMRHAALEHFGRGVVGGVEHPCDRHLSVALRVPLDRIFEEACKRLGGQRHEVGGSVFDGRGGLRDQITVFALECSLQQSLGVGGVRGGCGLSDGFDALFEFLGHPANARTDERTA